MLLSGKAGTRLDGLVRRLRSWNISLLYLVRAMKWWLVLNLRVRVKKSSMSQLIIRPSARTPSDLSKSTCLYHWVVKKEGPLPFLRRLLC